MGAAERDQTLAPLRSLSKSKNTSGEALAEFSGRRQVAKTHKILGG
jgi:hypothetical protein